MNYPEFSIYKERNWISFEPCLLSWGISRYHGKIYGFEGNHCKRKNIGGKFWPKCTTESSKDVNENKNGLENKLARSG